MNPKFEAEHAGDIAHEKHCRALKTAAKALLDKIDEVDAHPSYRGVWGFCAAHGYHYDGPTYVSERATLKALLEDSPTP